MRCIGKCGKNHPPADIVWVFGDRKAICRKCFPDYKGIPIGVRARQVAIGLPAVKPKTRSTRDVADQGLLFETEA